MKRQKPWDGKPDGITRCGFYITIDGQEFGPFLDKDRDQYKKLQRGMNVQFRNVCLKDGWQVALVVPKKVKKSTMPLFGNNGMEDD
jgi:hypothetical protein